MQKQAIRFINLVPLPRYDSGACSYSFRQSSRAGGIAVMLHDTAPARLSAYVVSCSFVPPYLSQPPARGIYRLWDRYQPPLARLSHSRQRRGL